MLDSSHTTMTNRKRNEYLDIDSEDEDRPSDYDSGAAEEDEVSRVAQIRGGAHRSKRRKLPKSSTSSSNSDSEEDPVLEVTPKQYSQNDDHPNSINPAPPTNGALVESSSPSDPPAEPQPTTKHLKPPSRKPKTAQSPARPRGVIYLSRIPPFMRPSTVRSLLSQHGEITRLFLTPEPPSSYLGRRARGGNRKKSYIDGWVEFASRREARVCTAAINAQTIGRKAGFYGNDVWNARFLKGFTWGDLMAGARAEEREREERVRVGLGREARERKAFLNSVEKGRRDVARQERRKGKGKEKGHEGGEDTKGDTNNTNTGNGTTPTSTTTATTNPPPQKKSTTTIPPTTTHPTEVNLKPNPTPPSSEMRFRQHALAPTAATRPGTTDPRHPETGSGTGTDNIVHRVLRQIF